jgi:hypothetical protein
MEFEQSELGAKVKIIASRIGKVSNLTLIHLFSIAALLQY